MEQRNEPSTAEIVRALRCSTDDDSFCKKCQYGYALAHAFLCDRGRMNGNAAARLESLTREIAIMKEEIDRRAELHKATYICYKNDISGITGELEKFKAFHERYAEQTSKKYVDDICALTARAESAEAERDAAKADMKFLDRCKTCFHAKTRHLLGSKCKSCKALSNFKWRGKPQEGEKE